MTYASVDEPYYFTLGPIEITWPECPDRIPESPPYFIGIQVFWGKEVVG